MPYDVNISTAVPVKTQHTPGPWVQFIWDATKPHIRTIGSEPLQDHVFQAEMSEADANLIAAAPELLEALKGLLKSCERRSGDPYLVEGYKAVEAAKEAIAKAEGRTNV